jgi:hypothetical protein
VSAAEPPSLPAWRIAPVRHPYCKAFDTAGWIRDLHVLDSHIFGVILKQGIGSVNKAGLAVHDLAGAAATEDFSAAASRLLRCSSAAAALPLTFHVIANSNTTHIHRPAYHQVSPGVFGIENFCYCSSQEAPPSPASQ